MRASERARVLENEHNNYYSPNGKHREPFHFHPRHDCDWLQTVTPLTLSLFLSLILSTPLSLLWGKRGEHTRPGPYIISFSFLTYERHPPTIPSVLLLLYVGCSLSLLIEKKTHTAVTYVWTCAIIMYKSWDSLGKRQWTMGGWCLSEWMTRRKGERKGLLIAMYFVVVNNDDIPPIMSVICYLRSLVYHPHLINN